MRRLPGPASWPLCDGVKTPEAHVELFRGWQSTQTQSSVPTLRSLRQQMDVWFCLMQESSAERHCCVTADPDQTNCAPSGARPKILCFSAFLLTLTYMDGCGQFGPLASSPLNCPSTRDPKEKGRNKPLSPSCPLCPRCEGWLPCEPRCVKSGVQGAASMP